MVWPVLFTPHLSCLGEQYLAEPLGHGLHLLSWCLLQSTRRATDPVLIIQMNNKTPICLYFVLPLRTSARKNGLPASMGCALLPAITQAWCSWFLAAKPLMSPHEPHIAQCPGDKGQLRNKTISISSFLCGTNSELPQQDLKEFL